MVILIPNNILERSTIGDTTLKSKVNELEDIYRKRGMADQEEGRMTQYHSRHRRVANKNSNTITRNIYT
jgi:hypothetical protein